MPALGTFIAGPYTAALDSQDLGVLDPQGEGRAIQLRTRRHKNPITGHQWGKTPIDGIHAGAEASISFVCEEQLAGVLRAIWPWSPTATASYTFADIGRLGTVGTLDTANGSNLVLTAVAGTPAATSGPATLTGLVIPTEQTTEMVMDTSLRKFPVEFMFLLQEYTGVERFFTTT